MPGSSGGSKAENVAWGQIVEGIEYSFKKFEEAIPSSSGDP